MRALIHVTAWERVSVWRRIVSAVGRVALLLVVLNVLGALLAPPLTIFFSVRSEANKLPWVSVVPQPLRDDSVSDAPGTTLTYFGYSFEVPWSGQFATKGSQGSNGGIMGVKFDSGQNVIVLAPKSQKGFFSEVVQDQSLHMGNLKPFFGDLINRSAYDQYSALLNISPSSVRPFGPRAPAVRDETLLTIKGIALPTSLATGAFSFQFSDKRGFQIGDPDKSRRISLEVFTSDGHYVEVLCTADSGAAGLSHPELNRILKTLHTVSIGPLVANTAGTKPL